MDAARAAVKNISHDEGDGPDFLLGASVQLTEYAGVFGEYRSTTLEDDTNAELEFTDYRVVVRFNF